MARFEIKFNDGLDHAEHDWLVLKDGQFVTGFAGSNAAERFVRDCEQEARALSPRRAAKSALPPSP